MGVQSVDGTLRIWWIVSAMLVLLMQVGFICLEMGCVRDVNRSGIAVKNFMMLLVSSLAFTLIGVQVMYGTDGVPLVGWGAPKLEGESYGWLFFQVGFACVAATILSGALAGRTTLISNAILALVMAVVIYPVFGHWMWADGGWLKTTSLMESAKPARDFAGSGVVHFVGGVAAFLAARAVGGRRGFLDDKGRPQPVGNRSLPFASVGVVFLWIGWIGFNGGSYKAAEIAEHGFKLVGVAALATCVAASAGGLVVTGAAALLRWKRGRARGLRFVEAIRQRLLFDAFGALSGTMGGMVAITANCDWLAKNHADTFLPIAAAIGAVGGLAAYGTAWVVRDICKVDDPVEAIGVHAGAGAAGILMVCFREPDFMPQLLSQVVALMAAGAWVGLVMVPTLMLLRMCGCLRCSEADEILGLTFESFDAAVRTSESIKEVTPHKPKVDSDTVEGSIHG